jgi:hypothetical protein
MSTVAMMWLALAVVGAVTILRVLAAIRAALAAGQESCAAVWREIAQAVTRGIEYLVLVGILAVVVHLDRLASPLVYPVAAMVGLRELATVATLAAGHVVELVPIDGQPLRPAGLSITPAFTVDSVTTLQSLITNHAVPSWARSVLFDDEAWSFTPINEQLFPAQAAAQAASLAHEASLSLWCTPALNLVPALDPTAPTNWQGYLSLDLAGQMGRACNGLDLQAQSLERNAQIYQEFVVQAAEQARAARPGLDLTAGLSTNPPGPTVSLSDLQAAVVATVAVTGGYWLNIPSPGPWCPTCAPANPALAVSLLTWM